MRRILRCVVLIISLVGCRWYALAGDPRVSSHAVGNAISPAAGESWLHHIHRSFGDTSMGKTDRLGPNPSEPTETLSNVQLGLLPAAPGQSVALRGSDLYRLNCRACHGETGVGAPPEINSIIDPVRATSITLVVERMKKRGMEITTAEAAELVRQSQKALLQRLHSGGQNMPPFSHLDEAEIHALLAYLDQLAGVPGAKQLAVTESPLRVGEHIVKSTCHICHDAAGVNPTPQDLENGAIPPLETLTARTDELQFIHKVTVGAPIIMGTPPTAHRGRMPVFYYLTPQEAADVYLYLKIDPPSELDGTAPPTATIQDNSSANTPSSTLPQTPHSTRSSSHGISDGTVTLLLVGLGSLAIALAIGGLCFVTYELTRLGRRGASNSVEAFQYKYPTENAGCLVQQPSLAKMSAHR